LLEQTLGECRWLYNKLLEDRKAAFEEAGEELTCFDQHKVITVLKSERPTLKVVHSQVLQNVAVRIDLAFKAYERRLKAKEKEPGYPRFRGAHRYDSFTFPQTGFSIIDSKVRLSKIGDVKMTYHRPVAGTIKTCNVKRSSTGKWYVSFSVECEPKRLRKSKKETGIDVGLKVFAKLSNADEIESPKFFRKEEKNLAKVQRKTGTFKKGERWPKKLRKRVARVHERVKFRRDNFTHQEARRIVNRYGVICVEDLRVNDLLHNHCLAKSISDSSWTQFFNKLSSKAEEAGRQFIAVNPAYTSQTCSKCGHRQKMPLNERTFDCPCCNLSLDRDHNAALNILAIGRDSLGLAPRSLSL
jgi:putative transposase